MEAKTFEIIMTNFNNILEECHSHLDNIKTTKDLEKISLKEAKELFTYCKKAQSTQDKVFCDVRHLLGMGNLTPVQTSQLIKCFKEYSSFRSDIKAIASNLSSISNLPKLPSTSTYDLVVLGPIKLTSELRGYKCSSQIITKSTKENVAAVDVDEKAEETDVNEDTENKKEVFKLITGFKDNELRKGSLIEVAPHQIYRMISAIKDSDCSHQSDEKLLNRLKSGAGLIANNTCTAEVITYNLPEVGEDRVYLYFADSCPTSTKFKNKLIQYLQKRGLWW